MDNDGNLLLGLLLHQTSGTSFIALPLKTSYISNPSLQAKRASFSHWAYHIPTAEIEAYING